MQALPKLIEPWFLFAIVWSIGATCDGLYRVKFSKFLHEKCTEHNVSMPFPEEGLVYDYKLDDGGVTQIAADDDEEDDKKATKKVAYVCMYKVLLYSWLSNLSWIYS